MKLDYVHLHQFGGLHDKRITFDPGLCAVVGDNDVGKSTVFEAIYHCLLTETKLGKVDFRKKLQRFVPLGDADHASAELGFSLGGDTYVLRKTWSLDADVRKVSLRLPDGKELASDATVSAKLEDILPAGRGTIGTILMTYQAGLSRVAEGFDEDALYSLDDLLRASVSEAGGVSVARFGEALESELDDIGSHWNFADARPEKNRDYHNPWKKEVGDILQAHYAQMRAEDAHEEALNSETQLDELSQKFFELQKNLAAADQYINDNKAAFDALASRKVLTAKLEKAEAEQKSAHSIYGDWSKAETEVDSLTKLVPELIENEAKLGTRRAEQEKGRQGANLRRQLKDAQKQAEAVRKANEALSKVAAVTIDTLAAIEDADDQATAAKGAATSGKLELSFVAKEDQELEIVRDLEPKEQKRVFAHKTLEVEADGRITVEHPAWAITVTSGSGDAKAAAEQYEKATAERDELLAEYSLADVKAARKAQREHARLTSEKTAAQNALHESLGDESLDELQAQIEGLGSEIDLSDANQVIANHATAETELKSKKATLNEQTDRVSAWKAEHVSLDAVLESLAAFKAEATSHKTARDELPAPPKGVSENDFEAGYSEKQTEREALRDNRGALLVQVEVARQQLGEVSSEELKAQAQASKRVFEAQMRRGEALRRIQEALGELDDEGGAGYAEIRKEIERLFAQLSGDKYAAPWSDDADKFLPEGFVRRCDNTEVPVEIMSHGMRDGVALACRVAMARYFLKDADGFLIMDDPLVNLDPSRQKQAAAILRQLAKDKQTIVFTCHRGHAEALEAEISNL